MADPVQFNSDGAARIVKAVRRVENLYPNSNAGGRFNGTPPVGFWARITGVYNATTGYPWTMIAPSDSTVNTFADSAAGATGINAFEPNGDKSLVSGQRVYLEIAGIAGDDVWYLVLSRPCELFPVIVAKEGSANDHGDATHKPTATYTVSTMAGSFVLATGKSPVWARAYGYHEYATRGTAYYDGSRALVLYQVDEVPGVC